MLRLVMIVLIGFGGAIVVGFGGAARATPDMTTVLLVLGLFAAAFVGVLQVVREGREPREQGTSDRRGRH